MENIILYIVAICFFIGAIDYILDNKFGFSSYFEEGIKNMGSLSISMIGVISLTPIIVDLLNEKIVPIIERFGFDPSIFTSSLIAVDMGGYNIAKSIGTNDNMIYFSGILMASILGCTLSFTLPLALGIVKKESIEYVSLGMLFGIITIPIGLFIGGIMLDVPINILIKNLVPIVVLALIISIGIVYFKNIVIKILSFIGKGIVFISILGLILQGLYSIVGIKLVKGLMPLSEALSIVGGIGIFLGGAYVMLQLIKILLKKPLEKLGKKFDVNNDTIAAFLGSFASAIIIFVDYEKLDYKGKVLCSAFSVGGAYVFGGQLGFVAGEAKEIINIYIAVKLICGFSAMFLCMIYMNKYKKTYKG